MDPLDFFYSDGVITLTNGSTIATGTFTSWDPAVLPYDILNADGQIAFIATVVSATELTLAMPWQGPTLIDVPYVITRWIKHTDPRIYGVRVSDYLTRLRAIPENFEEVGAQVAADAIQTAEDRVQTGLDVIATADDRVQTGQDRTAASGSAASALAHYNAFRGIYYGPLASDPTTDPNGAAPQAGDFYFNTTSGTLRIYTGAIWSTAVLDASGAVLKANNLSDLASPAIARTNLGISTFGATLIDDADAAAARATIGLKWTPIGTVVVDGVNLAEVTVTIPATVSMVRVAGCVFASTATAGQFAARVSLNNGATYPFGATDYNFGNLINVGTSVSAAGNASTPSMYLTASHIIAGSLPVFVDALFSVGGGQSAAYHSKSSAFNFAAANGYVNSFYNGYYTVPGRVTNLKFFFSGGQQLSSGTRLVIEGL
ncbi:MAG: SIO1p08 [Microvirga sp.]|jgi:hypothetical protein|nr:SIO1p08 [Microvirga sp.]